MDTSADRDPGKFLTIPVVFPVFGAKVPHNTVQATIRIRQFQSYYDLADEILYVGIGVLRKILGEDDDRVTEEMHKLGRSMSLLGTVYFVWDFAPQIQFTETGYSMPAYGTSEASCLSHEQLSEYLHTACTGRISYIFIAAEITPDGVKRTGLKEIE
ncbi:hypothetical protein O1611_g7935 [Lasiodiplodia mahajangana]|uniref:Uncharacterized protein n=1 Tax=Lasiodiplodia mahajangana TaxID=1108764 RepID=A0ACC2JDU7_9PEZI|nr:hypothetical protein O1611_g7935 [Lasiodiplodia mahajangana]